MATAGLALAAALCYGVSGKVGVAQAEEVVIIKEGHEKAPKLHDALRALREAKTELKEARHDFGGHREESLKSVEHAIEQLEVALKYAR
jgi:hypothetical protein